MEPSRRPVLNPSLSELMGIPGVRVMTWAIVVVGLALATWLSVRAWSRPHLPGSTVLAFVIVGFAAAFVWVAVMILVVSVRWLRERLRQK